MICAQHESPSPQVLVPALYSPYTGQGLTLCDTITSLSWCQRARSTRNDSLTVLVKLAEYGSQSDVTRVCRDERRQRRIKHGERSTGDDGLTHIVEGVLHLGRPAERSCAFPQLTPKHLHTCAVVLQEAAVKTKQAQHGLQLLDRLRRTQVSDALNAGWVHRNALPRDHESKKLDRINTEQTLVSVKGYLVLLKPIQHRLEPAVMLSSRPAVHDDIVKVDLNPL